jgi:hypothetical protein
MLYATEDQMLDAVEADAGSRQFLAAANDRLHPSRLAPWLKPGARAGDFKMCEIRRGSQSIAVFWYWISQGNRALVINAVASKLEGEDIFQDFERGVENFARQLGLLQIQVGTARRGMLKKLRGAGYITEEIRLTKQLPAASGDAAYKTP